MIYFIDQIKTIQVNLRNTEFEFEIDREYNEVLNEAESFLSATNGGSEIPRNFSKVIIIAKSPIYNIINENSMVIDNNAQNSRANLKLIGEGSYAKAFKYKDPYYNETFAIKRALSSLTSEEYERF